MRSSYWLHIALTLGMSGLPEQAGKIALGVCVSILMFTVEKLRRRDVRLTIC